MFLDLSFFFSFYRFSRLIYNLCPYFQSVKTIFKDFFLSTVMMHAKGLFLICLYFVYQ
jgi:hypothetical protein